MSSTSSSREVSDYPRTKITTGEKVVRVKWSGVYEALFEVDGEQLIPFSIEKQTGTFSTESYPPSVVHIDDGILEILEVKGYTIAEEGDA